MHRSDDEFEHFDPELVDVLKRVGGPAPEPGAAQRIADGAWARAARTRDRIDTGKVTGGRRNLVLFGHVTLGRGLLAAAASLVALAVVFSMGGTEPVLAVEGDPVRVWNGQRWEQATEVGAGQFVHVPEGDRQIRAPDGGVMRPQPGALFRVLRESGGGRTHDRRLRIEVRVGSTSVVGGAIALETARLEVLPSPGGEISRYEVTLGAGPTSAVSDSPIRIIAAAGKLPRIHVESGLVTVRLRRTGEELHLEPSEGATMLGLGSTFRLVRELDWSADVPDRILSGLVRGALPVDVTATADGAMRIVLGGQGSSFTSLRVRSDDFESALGHINWYFGSLVTGAHSTGSSGPGFSGLRLPAFHVAVQAVVRTDAPPVDKFLREYEAVKDGVSTKVTVAGRRRGVYWGVHWGVRYEKDGGVEMFPSLPALHAAHPELAELFGGHLPAR